MDLGVIMHKSAKLSRQSVEAEKEANSTVGTIRRKIVNSVKDTLRLLRLYKCNVRPQLEYYTQVIQARNQDFTLTEAKGREIMPKARSPSRLGGLGERRK